MTSNWSIEPLLKKKPPGVAMKIACIISVYSVLLLRLLVLIQTRYIWFISNMYDKFLICIKQSKHFLHYLYFPIYRLFKFFFFNSLFHSCFSADNEIYISYVDLYLKKTIEDVYSYTLITLLIILDLAS